VGTNGRIGANGEHSWADAPVVGHFWEYLLANDLIGSKYDPEGNCFGSIMDVPPKARKLRWEIPVECQTIINNCLKVLQLMTCILKSI
jgi:carnitine O-palmitoyltransferase 1